MTTAPTSVAWIGLGAIGTPMARTAAEAGFPLAAFDLNPAARDALADVATPAPSARDAARGADVVAVMVATPAQLDTVLFGEGGIAEVLTAETTLLIMATVGPAAIEQTLAGLEGITARVVDAPVSGGAARAAQGDLLVMVGGVEADVATVRPCSTPSPRMPPWWGRSPATGSASRSSTNCCAACTSPPPGRRSPSPTRWVWTSPRSTRCSAPVRPRPSCSAIAASAWSTAPSTTSAPR